MIPIEKKHKVDEILTCFRLSDDDLRQVQSTIRHEMDQGLSAATNASSDLKMFITYVCSLPTGQEAGTFLALDLGGTNFRVLRIELNGAHVDMSNQIYMVPESVMVGTGEELFDHIAECIHKFIKSQNLPLPAGELPLGFTFSFPCRQEGLAKARLTTWTKGFKASGVEGEDVVQLLHEACQRKSVNVKCVAVINDTVGALMSCAFDDNNCRIGLILGTGTNACYVESVKKAELYDGDMSEEKVVINTEWGALGNNGCLKRFLTTYDTEVDSISLNPGRQIYEKMISGMYMGEIARQVILQMVHDGLLFGGKASDELLKHGHFYTKYLSEIESDAKEQLPDYPRTKVVLEELGVDEYSLEDCHILADVCEAVSSRAASLAAAGIAVLLEKVDEPNVTVAVDGSLFRFHPSFQTVLREKTEALVKPNHQFKMLLSYDGSGKGAALVAAAACGRQRLPGVANGSALAPLE